MSDALVQPADRLLLAALAISALGLVLPTLAPRPLVLDEHASYWLCEGDVPLSIFERNIAYAATPPMSAWTQRVALALFGKHEWSLRLPSVLGYLIAVVGMFFGCRGMLGTTGAILATLALTWHPDVVDEVRIGRPYGLVLAEMVALLTLTLQAIRLLTSTRDEVPVLPGVLWGLAAAAAVWTHVLTIPPIAMTGLALAAVDLSVGRRLRKITFAAGLVAIGCSLPLRPMLLRMWDWRQALNYQTGTADFLASMGTFIWIALPLALFMRFIVRSQGADAPQIARKTERTLLIVLFIAGVIPVLAVAFMASDLASLNNPRYRLPLAVAQACLFGLLLARSNRAVGVAALVVALAASWIVADRSPFTLTRLSPPQAVAWQDIGKSLAKVVGNESLGSADVYVQSGIIEGTLIPEFFADPQFHGYVSSRLGRFYAPTPNPRFALPLFWAPDYRSMIEFFDQRLTAVPDGGSLFVAIATDTDLNRASFEGFRQMLEQYGYEIIPIADHPPWAVFYHCRRKLQ